MTIQFSTAVRNAMLDVIESTIGVSAKLQIWTNVSGVPANCAAGNGTNVKIVEYSLASDWAAAAASGQKILNGLTLSSTGIGGGGTAAYYRFTDSAGTTCHEQGTVTVTGGGGDMTIDNTVIASGQTVQITGFTKTAPGA